MYKRVYVPNRCMANNVVYIYVICDKLKLYNYLLNEINQKPLKCEQIVKGQGKMVSNSLLFYSTK